MPQPVNTLLFQALAFKSAWNAAQENADPKAVHHLRSSLRRLEATIELLTGVTGDARLRPASQSLRRSLRKTRRAAGEIRDFDVHRELLAAYPEDHSTATLAHRLRRARKRVAHRLQKQLKRDKSKVQRALDELEVVLEPALDRTMSGDEIAAFARNWFARAVRGLDGKQDNQLHAIRKASKTARYLADIGAAASKDAARAALHFEEVQQSLGAWHDHLLLHQEAAARFQPKNSFARASEADSLRLRHQALCAAERLMKRLKKLGNCHSAPPQKQRRRLGWA